MRNKTGNAETQRDEAKLPGHVQHDPPIGADFGVWTVVLTLAEINGSEPWIRRSSDGTKMQNYVQQDDPIACVDDP